MRSRLELVSIANEFNLNVECCKYLWLDFMSDAMGMKKVENDADALRMAHSIDFCREVNNFANVTRLAA